MSKSRVFRVAPERVVVLPKGVAPGPGGRAAMHKAGDVFTLTAEQAANRYIRNRLKLGDIIEVVAPAPAKGADR